MAANPAQARVEAMLQGYSSEQLQSLSIYLDAMNGEGDPLVLQKTPPPPPALLSALLALLKELEVHAADAKGAMAAVRLGVQQVLTVEAPKRASIATSPMFIRSSAPKNPDRR
jgi:hypothetical protein